MLSAVTSLLLCQLAGEAFVRVAGLPLPGPVMGMVLLFGLMLMRAPLPPALADTADGMLKHLSLLFVPAGVGVVQHLDMLARHGIRLLLVVVLSTVIALTVTALVFAALARLTGAESSEDGEEAAQ